MKISKKEVKHLAYLSRLDLSEEEVEEFSGELTKIFDYVEKIKELKTDKVKPYLADASKNRKRNDQVKKFLKNQEIVSQAPEKEDNFIKVRAVFK